MIEGPILPLLSLVWPLLLGVVASLPPMQARAISLLPLAPLPALAAAWAGVRGETVVPDLLLGAVLSAGAEGALLFGMTAVLWFAAGIYALVYLRDTRRPAVFAGFWCLTFAGNLGVFVAADVATFYVSFAAVSLAAYALVVADGTDEALRAGRIYLVLAVLGEACLLLGLILGAGAAGSLSLPEVRAALVGEPVAAVLLIVAFGVKVGLVPLHVWLPLAHPAAPTPASAVLSGAIVKAGVIGFILLVPEVPWLVPAGLATAFLGAVLGLTQRHPKAILGYSTVSQMGLIVALLGAGDAGPAAYHAMHHGLAKGALFLSVGLVAAAAGRWRWLALGTVALAAMSVAGVPLTGGALAKAAGKGALEPWAATAVTVSGATTTLILGWFLLCLARQPGKGRPSLLLTVPTLALALAAIVVPWWLWQGWTGLPADYPLHADTVWSSAWPVGLGLAVLALVALRPVSHVPAGDIVIWVERTVRDLRHWFLRTALERSGKVRAPRPRAGRAGVVAEVAERRLLRWGWSGTAMVLAALAIAGTLLG